MIDIIWVTVIAIFAVFMITIALLWTEIMSFLFPSNYVSVTMLESDNNVRNVKIRKPDNLKFKFNEGSYNLFESKVGQLKSKTAIYRSGRLGHFIFIEGNENPVDLRNLDVTGNPILNEQILKQDLSALWIEPKSSMEQFKDLIVPILVIGAVIVLAIVVYYAVTNNPTGINPQGVVVK